MEGWKEILKEDDLEKGWPFSKPTQIGQTKFRASKDILNQIQNKYNELIPKGQRIADSFIFNVAIQGKNYGGTIQLDNVDISSAEQKALSSQQEQQQRTVMPDEARRLGWYYG